MARPKTFNEIVAEAVEDVAEHGFDEARLERWQEKIRKAAERSLPSEKDMDRMLRESLIATYKRLIENGDIARTHQGVSIFTYKKLKPQLKAELDKHIMASTRLIKLNRKAAVDRTLARFVGWTSSVPKAGTDAVNKKSERDGLKKAMQSLPFIERRLLIDQGHKLTAAIDNVIAKDAGAIAMIWHSRWRQKNYDYREDHKERDLKFWAIRGNWAIEKGLMKAGPNGYYDTITQVAEEISCRCFAEWCYSLSQLPLDMLTVKGKAALAEVRAKMAG
jgi:hypothetical protein